MNCDRPVVLALSGMGKAPATTATALIERFGARVSCLRRGRWRGDGVRVGDVVVASDHLQHDMDASPLFPRWELPGWRRAPGLRHGADCYLLHAASACLERAGGALDAP